MNPERFQQIDRLFQAALDVPISARPGWLARECAGDATLLEEVQSLLDADGSGAAGFVEARVRQAVVTLAETEPVSVTRAGPYELVRQIGHGGMGTVWLARRADDQYQSTVAVKLVRPGFDTDFILHRFRRERQILAQLSHPNIGRLLDGGTTPDGTPFIVMEFIDGVWITEYCERHRLDIQARVRLFLQVCAAVGYAHQQLIVHRDLKPGNILVDSTGIPKLLDFGIGKLLYADPLAGDVTQTQGVGIMTPDYASPEQVRGEAVGVASDVYSLGAILYELATGVGPHPIERYTPLAVEEAICQRDVIRPSARVSDRRLASALSPDLDTIILKALQKEPEHRYASVSDFAEDLQRYLEHRPIRARPETAFYTVRKFVRRNRMLVSATAAVVLALIVGAAMAIRQAQIANANARELRELARAVIFDVHDAVRDVPGATKARQTVVDAALGFLDKLAQRGDRDPGLLRELAEGYMRIGDVQGNSSRGPNLGDVKGALASYQKAADLLPAVLATDPRNGPALLDQATVLQRMGQLQATTGGREAITTYAAAVQAARALLSLDPKNRAGRALLADVLTESGLLRRQASDMQGALAEVQESLQHLEWLHKDDPSQEQLVVSLASAESAMGLVLARLEHLKGAATHYDRAVAYLEELTKRQPSSVQYRRNLMIAYSHVGDTAGFPTMPNLNDPARAEDAYRRMAAIARDLRQADPQDARSVVDEGIALMRLAVTIPDARLDEKLLALEQSRSLLEQAIERRPADLNVRINHGYVSTITADLLRGRGRATEALQVNRRAAEILEPVLGAANPTLVSYYVLAQGPIAEDLAQQGDRRRALALVARLVDLAEREAAGQKDDRVVGQRAARPRAYAVAMRVHRVLGQHADAEMWRQKALTAWKALDGKAGFVDSFRREMRALEERAS